MEIALQYDKRLYNFIRFSFLGGSCYMNKFYFTEVANIETQTFDNSLEHFHSAGISGTIRENIQNSIDAKIPGIDKPVIVKIRAGDIKKSEIPAINQIEEHINSLEGGNGYTRETIGYMKQVIAKDKVSVLTFEDCNTRGLSGANEIDKMTSYNVFAYKKGVHFEEENDEAEIIRGGSHGVGKIANNALSDIHLMYFANCDEKGNQHLGGTIQLIEHQVNGTSYRSTGYFSNMNNLKQFIPYQNYNNHELFRKKTRGLKIIVPFFRDKDLEEKTIVRAVCDNFFLALLTNKLRVILVNDEDTLEINKDTIHEIVQNKYYYPENLDNKVGIKKNFTPLYVDTYLHKAPIDLEVSLTENKFNFKLYFAYDEEIKTGRVAIVRSMGMKIVDHKVKNYVRRPFNAVLIGSAKEDKYLKTLENESHTELSPAALRDKKMIRDAKEFLKLLNKKIAEIIDAEWEKTNPSDGKIDTSDLLYKKEITFKAQLNELSEKIELKEGKILRKKVAREKRNTSQSKADTLAKSKPTGRLRRPRKIKKDPNDQSTVETILAPNETVNRMMLTDKEIIQFNLKGIKEVLPFGKINISFRVVDGDGKEYDEEFNMENSYNNVIDSISRRPYRFDSFTIYEVQVLDGIVKLEINQKNNHSGKLKFIYKLEVLS